MSRNLGPPNSIRVAGLKQRDRFGHFDPITGRVTFWARKSVSIPRVVGEIQRIYPLAERESLKPV